jgi:hypothetical protein
MANSENTAVNELIARVSGGPTSSPVAAPPRLAPSAFPTYTPAPPPPSPEELAENLDHAVTLKAGAPLHVARPTSMPVAAPFDTQPGMPVSYPVVPRATIEPSGPMASAAPAAAYGDPGVPQSWAMPAAGPAWTDPAPLNAPRERSAEHLIGTLRLSRRSDLQIVISKLVLPMTILLVVGMLIGGYVAFHGDGGFPRIPASASATDHQAPRPVEPPPAALTVQAAAAIAAPTPVPATVAPATEPAQPQPAAAPAAGSVSAGAATTGDPAAIANAEPAAARPEPPAPAPASAPPIEPARTATVAPPAPPIAAPAPAPAVAAPAPPPEVVAAPSPATALALVDVRIDSTPRGATVTLVDRGKTQYIGSTPVSAAVDPSREYDLVFTYPNKPTTLEHLDASTTRRVAVTLGAPAAAAKPSKPTTLEHLDASTTRRIAVTLGAPAAAAKPADGAPHHVDRASAEPAPAPRKPRQVAESAAGEGTLKISSKPPCEIVIDGKQTGLVTPQIAIALSAGTHRVTLVNREKDIKKTFSVQLAANTTEKIIEDFMK